MSIYSRLTCTAVLIGMAVYWLYGFVWGGGQAAVAASLVPFYGKFVWTDITAAFVLFAIIVSNYERSVFKGILMFVAMNLFGSAAMAAWLLWRGSRLFARFRDESAV